MKKPDECRDKLRKRKLFQVEDLDAGSLRLCTSNSSCYTTNCCNDDAPVFKKHKKSTYDCARDMRISKRLGWFRFYTRQDEEEEQFLGVSTKLTLAINGNDTTTDPWKINKTLEQSDCDHVCRLMLGKDKVQKHIIKVWEDAGNVDEIAKVLDHQGGGVAVKVWDYERGKEYELKFKKLISSQCYILYLVEHGATSLSKRGDSRKATPLAFTGTHPTQASKGELQGVSVNWFPESAMAVVMGIREATIKEL